MKVLRNNFVVMSLIISWLLTGCLSVEPRILKVEDRLKPPYNYLLLKEVGNDTTFDYKWSNYDDGYLRMGDKFLKAYVHIMNRMESQPQDFMFNIYKNQKDEIVARFKQNGEGIQAIHERSVLNAFTKILLDETESIIETGDEFSVVNDITIVIPRMDDK